VSSRCRSRQLTIDAITLAVGNSRTAVCRLPRDVPSQGNVIDYLRAHVTTDSEADEIVRMTTEFNELVESWIKSKFPSMKR
jgi:hypothetical protein